MYVTKRAAILFGTAWIIIGFSFMVSIVFAGFR